MYPDKTIFYKFKVPRPDNTKYVACLMLQDWIDSVSTNYTTNIYDNEMLFNFNSIEDAILTKLKGIPINLSEYIEIL